MIEPHRTLSPPGNGIVRDTDPTDRHSEYPKHMAHPGFQPGKVGTEVKSPHGFSYHVGGEAIRFPPVLVMDADQEEYHASQGYVSVGKSDPAAFARAVQAASPQAEEHVPDEYPKWIASLNRSVGSAEEEAEALGMPPPVENAVKDNAAETMLEVAEARRGGIQRQATDSKRVDALEQDVKALDEKVDRVLSSVSALADLVTRMASPALPPPSEDPDPSLTEPDRVFAPKPAPIAEPEPEPPAPRPRRRRAAATGNGDEPV
jgi:hypothetical protein